MTGKEYAQIITINKSNIDFGKVEQLDFLISNTGNSQLKNLVFHGQIPLKLYFLLILIIQNILNI